MSSAWGTAWGSAWGNAWGDDAAGGIVDAALIVTCTSTARFSPLDANAVATPVISGGSSRKRRRIYYDEAPLPRYGTPVKAHLHAVAISGARFAPMVAGAQLVAVLGQGAAVARLVAQFAQAVPGALAGSTDSDAALRPQLGQAVSAHAHAAHESGARLSPTITTRTVIVPLRPRVELADDELAAILYLMAA